MAIIHAQEEIICHTPNGTSIVFKLGEMLNLAEQEFGPTHSPFKLLGIEFTDDGPNTTIILQR